MSEERGLAMIQASVARALIKCEGMRARNLFRVQCGGQLLYVEEDFLRIIDEEGIGENDVLRTMLFHEEGVTM